MERLIHYACDRLHAVGEAQDEAELLTMRVHVLEHGGVLDGAVFRRIIDIRDIAAKAGLVLAVTGG